MAKAVSKNFVALMIYDHKDKETMKKYKVRAFPTFVVTDGEGIELARQVGAPFSTPDEATKWFNDLNAAIDGIPALEASYEESADNVKVARKLAEAYAVLGKADEASEIYDGLVKNLDENSKAFDKLAAEYAEAYAGLRKSDKAAALYDKLVSRLDEESDDYVTKLLGFAEAFAGIRNSAKALEIYDIVLTKVDKKDIRYTDVRLAQGDAMVKGITRSNQSESVKKIDALYSEILPGLIKSKDERAVKPGILGARIKGLFLVDKDFEGGRKLLKQLIDAFPKHGQVIEMKYWRASIAVKAEDTETAEAEFKAIISEGPEGNRYVKRAKSALKRMGSRK